VGRPNDPTWDQVVHDAAAVMEEVREAGFEEGCFSEKFLSHRRGEFVAFPVGVSFGGGQKVCAFIPNHLPSCIPSTRNQGTLSIPRSDKSLQRR